MQKIGFIRPDGHIDMLTYTNLASYCQKICESEEYRERFSEFRKDYSYFSPYFDFVMFELNYIFVNPLLLTRRYVGAVDQALFRDELMGFDYQENILALNNQANTSYSISFITKCSDTELGIQKERCDEGRDVLIDCNLVGMMSKSGTLDGSHAVTANTVLNQLLMASPKIAWQYSYFLETEGVDPDNDALRFLVEYLGFIRATANSKFLLGNEKIYSEEQKKFVSQRIENGFQAYDCGSFNIDLTSQYQFHFSKH